jgi:hypothetical protein
VSQRGESQQLGTAPGAGQRLNAQQVAQEVTENMRRGVRPVSPEEGEGEVTPVVVGGGRHVCIPPTPAARVSSSGSQAWGVASGRTMNFEKPTSRYDSIRARKPSRPIGTI